MSVIVLKDEIEQIGDALMWDALGQRHYLHTVCDYPVHPTQSSIDDDKLQIKAWTNRLYVANQIAYIFTYSHREDCDLKIHQIDIEPWNHGEELIKNPARFYRVLESVKYNLYSNGGQIMLCAEDMVKLNDLIAIIARDIVGEYQKGKVA